jgi:hypothetical protein
MWTGMLSVVDVDMTNVTGGWLKLWPVFYQTFPDMVLSWAEPGSCGPFKRLLAFDYI